MKETGKILGIDYGESSIGLAISDESKQFVFGRGVLKTNPTRGLKDIFTKIAALCTSEKIQTIIIGLPLNEEGQETVQTKRIRRFAHKLQSSVSTIQIVFEDESFSSFEADELMKGSSLKPSQKKELQHELAASIILKKFLKIS